MTIAALQLLVIALTAAPLIHFAPHLEGDERHRIDRIEDARDEARWWLVRLERGYV